MEQKGSFNITILAMFSLVLTVLASYSVTHAQGWYGANWLYRKAITIDSTQVDATLTNFPVLIDITDTDLASGARPDGFDMLFTDDTGTAKLDHEIESYATGTGHLIAWVEVPSLASSLPDTVIYLYYGNPGATDQQNPTGVWDDNYVMVQHLEETAGNHNDSTIKDNNGTPSADVTQDTTGNIDGADEFAGTSTTGDYIRVPSATSLQFDVGSFTAEAWIYPHSVPNSGGARIINTRGTGGGGTYPGWQFKIKSSGSSNWYFSDASVDDATGNYMDYEGTTSYVNNAWYHVVMVYEADTELRFYVNGASDGPPLTVGDYGSISNLLPTVIGASIAENGSEAGPDKQFFDGIIDEVRLSNIDRSADWILTSYANQDDPASFSSLGPEEPQPQCTLDTDCDDSDVCTDDTCVDGTCSYTNNTDPCDDSIACTESDVCSGGTCNGTPNNTLCSDSNSCTDDVCTVGVGCSNPNNTDPCDDSIACTESDVCSGGTCNGTPNNTLCSDSNGCTDDVCTVGVGCSNPNNTDPCDDSIACTESDVCSGGACNGTPNNTLCSDGNGCTDDVCTVGVGCSNPNNTDPCDDSIACTESDVCSGGACNGTPNNTLCSDGNGCTDDVCTVGVGCSNPNNTDPCDDSIACTESDVCSGGACNGTPNNTLCSDSNSCTDDVCTVGVGCSNPNNTDPCDDSIACTESDVCSGGACNGTPNNTLCSDSNSCTDDVCTVGVGCSNPNNTDPCDDSIACTESDVCSGGACNGTPNNTLCSDGNGCTDDVCTVGVGCSNPNNTDPCDDSIACTESDVCSGGACNGTPNNTLCSDSNGCTDDVCTVGVGCSNPNNTDPCDDSIACTESDVCSGGACNGTPNNTLCSDSNSCTDDVCTVGVGCSNLNNTNSCDDNVFCNGPDTCSGGSCSVHAGDPCTPQLCNEGTGTCVNCLVDGDCEDSTVCTDDSCINGFCNHVNNTAPCDDGDDCTTGETCYAGICEEGTPLDCDDGDVCTDDSCVGGTCSNDYNTAPCDDDDACTEGDTCTAGTCGGSTVDCDDGEVCTTDTCDTGTGCVNTPVAGSCDDGNACTEGDTCTAGTCGGSTVDCDDGDACTTDTCDTVAGCVNTPAGDGSTCDDGDACTENDVCTGGSCAGSTVNCDDSEECTTDTCDTVAGCVNTPVGDGSTCDDGFFCTDLDHCLAGECTGSGDPCVPDPCDEVNDVCLTDWWDDEWLFRKAITIDPDNVDADLTDFPVLIDLTDTDLATYAQSSGNDLVFTDDNKFQLSHEIAFYDNATGTLLTWVRVPDLYSTEETVLYLYFGNSAADNQEDVAGTWDSNYVMVQHLDETEGPHFDSTSNANDGTAYDLATQDALGKIDGADEFDASGDLIDVGTDASLDVFGPGQDFSIFLWVKRDATTETEGFFSSGSDGFNGIYFGSASGNEDNLKFMSLNNTVSIESASGVIGDTEWHHVGVTADRDDTLTFWVDSVPVHSESIAGTSAQNWNRADDTYKIGTDRSEMSPMDGILDEVRVSDMVMGAEWIQTSYTNQNNPGAFYLLGDLEIVADADEDGVPDVLDNCLNYPNGPLQGTCTEDDGVNLIVRTGRFCTVDADCDPGEFCEKTQADTYPPGGDGIGDACDCEADFDCDSPGLDVDAMNVEQFIWDFGRSLYRDPCTAVRPCYGDFNCDGNVDADDIPKILEDFGRTLYINPCPACVRIPADWCMSP